ncbi:sulfite exporter TauE/SafE family protein [Streptomyces sp. NPDC001255]|uniref:sulfite exporter TauE/SafE family protein n=1 Tax=Streptomyces sp. NPDC001255 TaxID=3364550 RepID=UPI00367BB0A3
MSVQQKSLALPPVTPLRPVRSVLRFNALLAVAVWVLWLAIGGVRALHAVREHWQVSVTMVFGSLVGGGTSEGGGAVAFPVFTKVLHIAADDARVFTYAIQSVGMSMASLSILYLRVPIERRIIAWASPAGVAGVVFGAVVVAPHMPLPEVRVYFTVLLTALAIAMVVMRLRRKERRNAAIPVFGAREAAVLVVAGFVGGLVSGLVGVGENTVAFIVLVMLFRVSEKVATPTTVILMTVVSLAALLSHVLVIDDFSAARVDYWLAAVPVVCVGAPLGALICSALSRSTIRNVLVALITVDLVSTVVIVPVPATTRVVAGVLLVAITAGCFLLTRVARYDPAETGHRAPASEIPPPRPSA